MSTEVFQWVALILLIVILVLLLTGRPWVRR